MTVSTVKVSLSAPYSYTSMKQLLGTLALFSLLAGLPLSPTWAQRGHYKGGRGSSHKGGTYKNKATHDHYRKRK